MLEITKNAVKVNQDGEMVPVGMLGTGFDHMAKVTEELIMVNQQPTEETKMHINIEDETATELLEKSDLKTNLDVEIPGYPLDATAGKTITTLLSDAWDVEKTYNVNDYCIYGSQLWKCKNQHSGHVPVQGIYWTSTSITNELGNSSSAGIDAALPSDIWSDAKTYFADDYCIYDNQLWICKTPNKGVAPEQGTYWRKTSIISELTPSLHTEFISKKAKLKLKKIGSIVFCTQIEGFSISVDSFTDDRYVLCELPSGFANWNTTYAPLAFNTHACVEISDKITIVKYSNATGFINIEPQLFTWDTTNIVILSEEEYNPPLLG